MSNTKIRIWVYKVQEIFVKWYSEITEGKEKGKESSIKKIGPYAGEMSMLSRD